MHTQPNMLRGAHIVTIMHTHTLPAAHTYKYTERFSKSISPNGDYVWIVPHAISLLSEAEAKNASTQACMDAWVYHTVHIHTRVLCAQARFLPAQKRVAFWQLQATKENKSQTFRLEHG
jgi:hypothetical protein